MGAWTDRLADPRAQGSYFAPFAVIAACMILAALSPPLIARIGGPLSPVSLAEEISPETMGAVP
jgi:hypothetical protein